MINIHDIDLTYPVIIMRTGGLDGVALQAREYRHLLNDIDINVHVITGKCETKFAPVNPIGHKQTIISRLDFYHKISKQLFSNQFEHGSEKEDKIPVLSKEEWLELFNIHKEKIKKSIDNILKSIPYNTPVLVYNLISLRHAQPAAAVAIKELMEKYPQRAFISHSADPDAERPEKIERIKEFALKKISCNPEDQEYSGGPYNMNNLYHIVLNPTQRENFIHKYNIPQNHVFEIPDFLDFPSDQPVRRKFAKRIFLRFVSERSLQSYRNTYKYKLEKVDKETVFFLAPVRPVYRKRLKESMLAAQQYGKKRGVKVAYVVTHPNMDDKHYFQKTVKFAESIGLPYFHLGKSFSLETLDSVYENFAALKSVGVISSSAGGWENALNEMARACIPFFMEKNLNSFKPLTEEIGIKTLGIDFSAFTPMIQEISHEELGDADLSDNPEMKKIFDWIDSMLLAKTRDELIEHNYKKAYDYLSHEATVARLVKGINYIYERHARPGCNIKASTLARFSHERLTEEELGQDLERLPLPE